MVGLLLNGLGVVKRSQDGEVNDRPRKTAMAEFARLAAKNVENEFNDRLIMTLLETMCTCSQLRQACLVRKLNRNTVFWKVSGGVRLRLLSLGDEQRGIECLLPS